MDIKEEVEALKKELADTKKNDRTWADHVDEFVEEWYENNKDDVDIGQIKIAGRWKVDLIPDELEINDPPIIVININPTKIA